MITARSDLIDGGATCAPKSGEAASELAALESKKVVLFVGRITPEKGVHVLIGAMHRVLERVPDAVLVVAGGFFPNPPTPLIYHQSTGLEHELERQKADYEASLRSFAEPLGDRVRFLSESSHGQLGPWYDAADVFVHPALWNEPFGMILTEAMAFGCPVVSTHSGGVPEIVNEGETGVLVERGNESALADAIADVLEDPAAAVRMGAAGRARLTETFVWDRTSARLMQLLERSFD